MRRREFLKNVSISTTALAVESMLPGAFADQTNTTATRPSRTGTIPTRRFGKNKDYLSIIGFGGIVVMNAEQKDADRLVAESVERGVNYFDVAPTYGNAEIILGESLKPFRKKVFLACKTTQRKKEGAQAELKSSLKRLHTDHLDLYQLHAITDVKKDVDTVFAKGGAMETMIEAKKAGLVRYLGFSTHSFEAASAAMDRFDFDSVLFPMNFVCYFKGDFGHRIATKAFKKGLARLAIKSLALRPWPKDDPRRKKYPKCWYEPISDRKVAEMALAFTLSQQVTAAIPPGDESAYRMALEIAGNIKPIRPEIIKKLKQLAETVDPIFKRDKNK